MKTKFDAEDLNLISLAKEYSSERKARKLFESLRWPDGKPVCPHCGFDEIYKLTSKKESRTKLRAGVYCCAACRKPFSATVGTVFESSHVPLSKILMAIFILCSSKKSISALQLSRMLKTTYRTAWFLAHRCRHAMATDLKTAKPLENTVEADETYCKNFSGEARQAIVALILERNGESRTRVIPSVTANTVGKFLNECVSQKATVNTDEHPSYKMALKGQERHQRVNHSKYEYARHNADGTVSHVNTCESWFSLMKRSVFGAWHCISPEHLPKYASELEYRWNTRHVSDGERMAQFVPLIAGKRLFYKQPAN
ncbi:MAG TPA: IS1595 family transposase [Verrucomicrobiae bacterium]|nr:IS1595 family transposase [Verrucomicrobiae bacterium]